MKKRFPDLKPYLEKQEIPYEFAQLNVEVFRCRWRDHRHVSKYDMSGMLPSKETDVSQKWVRTTIYHATNRTLSAGHKLLVLNQYKNILKFTGLLRCCISASTVLNVHPEKSPCRSSYRYKRENY